VINYRVLIAILYFIAGLAWADLSPEQLIAKEKGLILYQQYKGISAIEPLRVAAEAGDKTAQYYLGETLRRNSMYITAESRKWYEAAAAQGDLFAMLRLSDSSDLCDLFGTCTGRAEWREKVLDLAYARAEHGDTEAMRVLFHAGEGLVWLEKAAGAGDLDAQWLLAERYEAGEGWFLIPGNRKKTIDNLLRKTAEAGLPKGMQFYAGVLHEKGDLAGAFQWRKKAAETGLIGGVYAYARDLLNEEGALDISPDTVKSYALFSLIARLQGGGGSPEYARWALDDLRKKMSNTQLKEAEDFAVEWRDTHPPLSYFLPVYGH
jgi:hypothetical protein